MYPQAQQLFLAVAAGDEGAFSKLYDLLAPRMYGIIRGVLPDAAQVDRVMTEALVEVWRAAPSYDANYGPAAGWIYAIAHHHAVLHAQTLRTTASR